MKFLGLELLKWINDAPKAELHVHIEGTLEPEMMFRLAEKNSIHIPYSSVEEVKKSYKFTDLQSFLNMYYLATTVLVTKQDFYDLTWAYIQKCKATNIVHTEIFVDPQSHTSRGIPVDDVFDGVFSALKKAKEEYGITSHVIMCFLRHLPQDDAIKTLDGSSKWHEEIIGVGLDSGERGNPPTKFTDVFASARKKGLRVVAHAGEEGPPEYIWDSLKELKAERIDHGVAALKDPSLVEYLAKQRIPLTVCPTSNYALRVYDRMEDVPIKTLLQKGICVTINSDDPAYFGGYMDVVFQKLVEAQPSLTLEDFKELLCNSFEASFLTAEEKKAHIKTVTQHYDNAVKRVP